MSTITSIWGPRVDIVGGTVYICGQPAHPVEPPTEVSIDDVARHGDAVVASPWASAVSIMSPSRLGDMVALNPQPLPPREKTIAALEHIDDFCGTRVPKRLPPPTPPTPFGGGVLPLHADVAADAQRFGAGVLHLPADAVGRLASVQMQSLLSQATGAAQLTSSVSHKLDDTLGAIVART